MKRYRFHREALDEYAAARQWYMNESKVARAFVDSVERAIRKIRRFPRAAGRVPGQTTEEIRRHVLRRFPYTIVYLVDPDEIFIVAVAHTRRLPWYWADRLKKR